MDRSDCCYFILTDRSLLGSYTSFSSSNEQPSSHSSLKSLFVLWFLRNPKASLLSVTMSDTLCSSLKKMKRVS